MKIQFEAAQRREAQESGEGVDTFALPAPGADGGAALGLRAACPATGQPQALGPCSTCKTSNDRVLMQARAAARHAAFEPPFLQQGSLKRWGRVLESLDALLTRVACLESALEGVATGEGDQTLV